MEIITKKNIQKDLASQIDLISRIVLSIESNNSKHTVGDRIEVATPLEFLYVYTHLISKEQNDSPLRKLFIDFFQSLETAFPAGAFVGAKLFLSQNPLKWKGPERLVSSRLFEGIKNLVGHESSHVVEQMVRSGGLYRPVIWDETIESGYVIEALENSSVKIRLDSDFSRCVVAGEVISKGIVFVCDSVFEKMSEIDSLTRGSIEENIPVFLVGRGFLPDVSFTLLHNYSIGKSKIIPCVIEGSDSDPFEMMDISKLLGTEVLPGPISVFTWNDLKKLGSEVSNCKIKKESIEIGSLDYSEIDDLIHQVVSDDREEISSSKRAQRILGNSIRVKFPRKSNDISKSRIRKGIKIYRQWAREGVCKTSSMQFPVPVGLVQKASRASRELKETLEKINVYVRIDDGLEKKMAVSQ